jgi:hypothetical protein
VALPRYIVKPKESPTTKNLVVRCFRKLFCKGGKELTRAEPGEREYPTKLYQPIFTPHKQLGDFGLGIGLYFSTLRATMVRANQQVRKRESFCPGVVVALTTFPLRSSRSSPAS